MKVTTLLLLWLISVPPVIADSLLVATAANFKPTLQKLLQDFDSTGSQSIRVSSASTGTLYAQAIHGAPFDILLAADTTRPQRLEAEGHAVAGSRVTYAIGQLVLVYQPALSALAESGLEEILSRPGLSLAIANPELAPYGQAAAQVLARRNLQAPQRSLLHASNVLQAYQMWFSGGADTALVARSLVSENYLVVPTQWYTPLEQQAVLMQIGASKPLALELMHYLQSERAQTIIAQHGYLIEGPAGG
ncbi:MAG: molybdate ABC transporter substrate-binding protein [Gammaproteobacteria bacterium]|nr:molybdate ABC transporter substrate-binding protein [Gammaproteobacteria bacterium]